MYILDTVHLTILQRGGQLAQQLKYKLADLDPNQVFTTIITYEEQTRGWLSYIAKQSSMDRWSNLINLYEGNPFYLKTIANSIRSVFNGYISDFLAENELIITKDIQTNLQLLFKGLSLIEQKIVIKLSNSEQFLSREELKTSLDLSSTDLINSLESLQNRYLLMKITEDKIMFILSPVFREYVRNCCKD